MFSLLRPYIFGLDPEVAHDLAIKSLKFNVLPKAFFHVDEDVYCILQGFILSRDGEIFVPKMDLFNIIEFANKISKNHKIIGIRQGEKLSESLLTDSEKKYSIEKNNMWIIKS